ncbi:TolC family protein [Persephonella sp.]
MLKRYIMAVVLLLWTTSYSETLSEILDFALKNSPSVKSFRYELKSAEGDVISAEKYPNPEVYIQFGRIYSQSESGFNLTEFSIHQQLRLWGIRSNAVDEALLKKEALKYAYESFENQLIGDIYGKFYEALYLKELLRIKEEEFKLVRSIYEFVEKNYSLGEETKLNLLRAKRDLKITEIEFDQVKTDYLLKLQELSSLVGKEIKNVKGDLRKIKDFHNYNIAEIPEIKYLSKILKSIDKSIELQKSLAKPQIGIEFIAGEDAAELGKYEFGIGITSTIPVFNRNQGEIFKLVNQKRSIVEKINQKKLIFSNKINGYTKKYNILKDQVTQIEDDTIPSLKEALKLGEMSFKQRVITLFELTDIRKQYIDALLYRADLYKQIQLIYSEYIKIGGLR